MIYSFFTCVQNKLYKHYLIPKCVNVISKIITIGLDPYSCFLDNRSFSRVCMSDNPRSADQSYSFLFGSALLFVGVVCYNSKYFVHDV